MEVFYDVIRVMKGPSFGTRFTLLCRSFIWLTTIGNLENRTRSLKEVGIGPELIHVPWGIEAYDEIEAVFEEALAFQWIMVYDEVGYNHPSSERAPEQVQPDASGGVGILEVFRARSGWRFEASGYTVLGLNAPVLSEADAGVRCCCR